MGIQRTEEQRSEKVIMKRVLFLALFANAKKTEKPWKCAVCKDDSLESNCIVADKPKRCQYGCFIMQNTENKTVDMGCITAGNPVVDLQKFNYKNDRWNH